MLLQLLVLGTAAAAAATTTFLPNDCTRENGHHTNSVLEFTTCEEFASKFWNKQPGVLRASGAFPTDFTSFLDQTSFHHLSTLTELGINLSTSVSYTGRVFRETSVAEYVLQYENNTASRLGNETFYLFGNHIGADWEAFLQHYPRLEMQSGFACLNLDPSAGALSFGTAGRDSGVPWHFHGAGFLQVLHGGKQWFLLPPETLNEDIGFDPNVSTKQWWLDTQARLPPRNLQVCELAAGDVIYFPPMWKHATLNTREWNTWISTFL